MKASSTAVFFREAFRNARRWQTYASRAGFAGVMLGLVLLIWWNQVERPGFDPSAMGKIGETIFRIYAYVQFWLMCVLSPIIVSQGIIEEKEDKTLDMLAITRLAPGQIIRGKLLSRILVLLVIIASGTPVMALIMSFGGVDPLSVVSVVVNTCLAVVVTGTMAAFLSLFTRGAILPTITAFLYTIPAFFVVPGAYFATAPWVPESYLRFTPALATESDWWGIWLPTVSFIPVLVMTLRIAGPLFEMVTSGGDDPEEGGFGYLSFHLWTFERFKKWGGLLSVLVMLSFPLALLGHSVPGVGVVWATGFLMAGTWLYLLIAMRVVLFLDKTLSKVPSVGLSRTPVGPAPVGPPGAPGVPAKKPRRRLMGAVWSNPVAWRDIATRAYGGITLFIIPAYLVYGAFLCLFVLILAVEPRQAPEVCAVMAAIVFVVAILAMVLNATAAIVTERRTGTLGLLASTTLPSYRIVMGKMTGVVAFTGPLLLSGMALLLFGAGVDLLDRGLYAEHSPSWSFFGGNPLMRAWWASAWVGALYLMLMLLSTTSALRLKSPGFAYGINLFMALAIPLVPAFFGLLFAGTPWVDVPAAILMPLASERFTGATAATPVELLISVCLYGSAVLVLFTLICWRLRPWIGATLR